MAPEELLVLARGKLDLLREISNALAAEGIAARIQQPPEGCGSG